jgi:uncharacterized protein YnzC (UPF0291/DUF896 family)
VYRKRFIGNEEASLKTVLDKIRITELTLKSLEEKITEEEFKELDAYISGSRENAAHFTIWRCEH